MDQFQKPWEYQTQMGGLESLYNAISYESFAVADPDLQIRGWVHSDQEIREGAHSEQEHFRNPIQMVPLDIRKFLL